MADRKPRPNRETEAPVRRRPGDSPRKAGWKVRLAKLAATRGWRVYGAGACLLAVAVLVLCVGLVLDSVWARSLDGLERDLQARLELAKLEAKQAMEDRSAGAEPAVYADEMTSPRRMRDDRTISDMISHATTWDSRLSYETARKELLAHYEWLTAETNPEFLLSFFPPPEDLYSRLGDAIIGDPLDDGRNIRFESVTTYLLSEDESGDRLYFAEATTQSSGTYGGVAAGHLAATYRTKADGSVWNLKCYAV